MSARPRMSCYSSCALETSSSLTTMGTSGAGTRDSSQAGPCSAASGFRAPRFSCKSECTAGVDNGPCATYSPPREEGWLRHQGNFGEAHFGAAAGVVAYTETWLVSYDFIFDGCALSGLRGLRSLKGDFATFN